MRMFPFIALVLCAGLLPAAHSSDAEYLILAQRDGARGQVTLSTYAYDDLLRQRSVSSDIWALARRSPQRLRFRLMGNQWYTVDGALRPNACGNGPGYYALSPSGASYVCVNRYFPDTELRVYRTSDDRLLTTLTPPGAVPERHSSFGFIDEDRIAFRADDQSCPRPYYSIDVITIRRPFERKRLFNCASSIIVGTRRIAYLSGDSERSAEYSLDGGRSWIAGRLFGLDRDDSPITAASPLLRRFAELHPDSEPLWISVSVPG